MTEAEKQYTEKMIADLQQSVCQWKERAEQAEALLEEIAKLAEGYTPVERELKAKIEHIPYSNTSRKLTPMQVKEIREARDRGINVSYLAREYEVCENTIYRCLQGG